MSVCGERCLGVGGSSRGLGLRLAGGAVLQDLSAAREVRLCSSHTALTLQMSPPQKYPNTSTWKREGDSMLWSCILKTHLHFAKGKYDCFKYIYCIS